MSDFQPADGETPRSFPVIIAITALVLAVSSGIVNYRQNDLSALERNLRDTRDQLQLAKNDIADIRINTVQQLADAEQTIKGRSQLQAEKSRLADELAEARIRIQELENRVRRLDRGEEPDRTPSIATTAKASPTADKPASASEVTPATSDIDVYLNKPDADKTADIDAALVEAGFAPKHPAPSPKMSFANTTTVFYYSSQYKPMAAKLAGELTGAGLGKAIYRRGSSPFSANKLVVHIVLP